MHLSGKLDLDNYIVVSKLRNQIFSSIFISNFGTAGALAVSFGVKFKIWDKFSKQKKKNPAKDRKEKTTTALKRERKRSIGR